MWIQPPIKLTSRPNSRSSMETIGCYIQECWLAGVVLPICVSQFAMVSVSCALCSALYLYSVPQMLCALSVCARLLRICALCSGSSCSHLAAHSPPPAYLLGLHLHCSAPHCLCVPCSPVSLVCPLVDNMDSCVQTSHCVGGQYVR
jgi:hypothetical protein